MELAARSAARDRLADGRWRRVRAVTAIGIAALALVACSNPGAPVAERIRAANSPIVLEVRYAPSNPLGDGGETLVVLLTDDATEAQALDLWCTVIVPAGGDQLPPSTLYVRQGEMPGPGGGVTGGHTILPYPTTVDGHFSYVDPKCPASASPTQSP
jgi:hypothetical protein